MDLKQSIWFLLILAFTLYGCAQDDDANNPTGEKALSVEAFIYVNESVPHVRLLEISDDAGSHGHPVSNADIVLSQDGQEIAFKPDEENPGIYHQEDTSQYVWGDVQPVLRIVHGAVDYQLPTTIPPALNGLTISNQTITLTPNNLDSVMATISWEPIEGYQYCIFIRNKSYDTFPVNYLGGSELTNGAFYNLHSDHQVELTCRDFTHYGSYDLYVTAVSDEYATFYSNPLSQPFLENNAGQTPCWGIFAAFNGRSIHVQVN